MALTYLTLGIFIIAINMAYSKHFSSETITACQTESGYTGNFQNFPTNADAPREGKCFLACLLEKDGIMVNGVIDRDIATAAINRITNGNVERAQRYLRILNECLAEVTPNPDKCEFSFQYMRCKQTKSMGK